MEKITNSLDWNRIESNISKKARGLLYERDIRRMIHNIHLEVCELSKAEVLARNGRSHKAEEMLKKINEDIETLQGFLLVAALLG